MTVQLKTFEEKLNLDQFIRVHRSFVINLTKIDELADTYLVIGRKKNHQQIAPRKLIEAFKVDLIL